MRASFLIAAGVALSLATPAFAGPAYTTDDVVKFFQPHEKTRSIHIDEAGDPPADAQPKTFDLMVNFEFDSDHLTPAAQANLDQFATALHDPRVTQNLKGEKLAIDGFTDATGTEVYNLNLSERRAEAVVNYLAQKGVDRATLVAKGYGPTKPRSADKFDPLNRRVETHLVE